MLSMRNQTCLIIFCMTITWNWLAKQNFHSLFVGSARAPQDNIEKTKLLVSLLMTFLVRKLCFFTENQPMPILEFCIVRICRNGQLFFLNAAHPRCKTNNTTGNAHLPQPRLGCLWQIFPHFTQCHWLPLVRKTWDRFSNLDTSVTQGWLMVHSDLAQYQAWWGWVTARSLRASLTSLPLQRGRAGGTKPTCRITLFFAWKPWDSDPTPRSLGHWLENTSELSASMITAAQFFGGIPSLHMCCFSLTCA